MISLKIRNMLKRINNSDANNIRVIEEIFGTVFYRTEYKENLLILLTSKKYDEEKCFLAIKTLLEAGVDPNEKSWSQNFVMCTIDIGYSEDFVIKIIKEALKYGFKVNETDNDIKNIVFYAIYSNKYKGNIATLYKLLIQNGLYRDSTYHRHTYSDAMIINKYSPQEIKEFMAVYKESFIEKESDDKYYELMKYGTILNKEKINNPKIERVDALNNLMLVLGKENKNAIIVDNYNADYNSVVYELLNRIKDCKVPDFLQNKIILKITALNELKNEFGISRLIKLTNEDIILFVSSIGNVKEIVQILKKYIDKTGYKVIITAPSLQNEEEIKEYFDIIKVEDPNKKERLQIIKRLLEISIEKSGLDFKKEKYKEAIAEILEEIKFNSIDSLVKVDEIYLILDIIDRAFANAKVNNSKYVDLNDFKKSLESFEYMNDYCKNKCKNKITDLGKSKIKKFLEDINW